MRKRLGLCAALFSLAISVAAVAMPLDTANFDVLLPITITSGELDISDTAMTHDDFVMAAPYEIVFTTIEHVPIEVSSNPTVIVNPMTKLNDAAELNTNFERNFNFD